MNPTAQLKIVIDAQNNASAQLKQVSGEAENAGLSFGKMAGAMALGNLASEAISKGVEFLHGTIHAAVEENNSMQASLTQIDNILESVGGTTGVTSESIKKQAETLSKMTPISEAASLAAAQMIVPFKQIGKDIFPNVLVASEDLATHLNKGLAPNTDQVAAAATKLGKAFADPEKAAGLLKKAGVVLTDQQKEAIKTMQDHNNMLGAQKLLYDDLDSVIGGSAIAAGHTFNGMITMVKNNLIEFIGAGIKKAQDALVSLWNWFDKHREIMTIVSRIISGLRQIAIQAFDYLKPKIEELGKALFGLFNPFKQFVSEYIVPLVKVLGPIVGAGLVWALGAVADIATFLLKDVLTPLMNFLDHHKTTVVALATAFGVLAAAMGLQSVIAALISAFGAVVTLFTVTIPAAAATASAAIAAALPVIAVAVAAAAIVAAIMTIRDAWNAVSAAARAANNLDNAATDNQIHQYQVQAAAARAAGDTKKATQLANAIAALTGGRAKGGSVSAGGIYAVGENPDGSWNRTTELFVPSTSGAIIPADQARSLVKNNRTVHIGTVILGTPGAAKEFFRQMDQDSINLGMGLTPNGGSG